MMILDSGLLFLGHTVYGQCCLMDIDVIAECIGRRVCCLENMYATCQLSRERKKDFYTATIGVRKLSTRVLPCF